MKTKEKKQKRYKKKVKQLRTALSLLANEVTTEKERADSIAGLLKQSYLLMIDSLSANCHYRLLEELSSGTVTHLECADVSELKEYVRKTFITSKPKSFYS